MGHVFTILPGQPMARLAAEHLLGAYGGDGLARAVLLLPTRRACNLMRLALIEQLGDKPALLPRILPLGDLETELPGLLTGNLEELAAIPPAMPAWKRIGLLMRQIVAFEQARGQGGMAMEQALGLARDLAALHDQCIREQVTLSMERLRGLLVTQEFAAHWELSLKFLAIVADSWALIEDEEGAITAAARQAKLQQLLIRQWRESPPDDPMIAIGSTASQPLTAELLQLIADLPQGAVILPGLDPATDPERWGCVAPGHPLVHLKSWLDKRGLLPADVRIIGEGASGENIWLTALECADEVPNWRTMRAKGAPSHIRLIPCAHGEEEARVIALLVREALEMPGKRVALVTPDEALMERAAAHLSRYGIAPNRVKHGTLANTETGSLWLAALHYIAEPMLALPLLALLRHPLVAARLGDWLEAMEPYARGLVQHQPGQLPSLPPALREGEAYARAAALLRGLAALHRYRHNASAWMGEISKLLRPFTQGDGEGADAVAEHLAALAETDLLGAIDRDDIGALLNEALREPWRGGIYEAHPDIFFLTPVEARLQQFDRVILANMQDTVWPGLNGGNAWLNLAQQQALGLPAPEEHASLMAHDLLLLGSQAEVFLTWPERDAGSPATRSRFIERLVALLAIRGVDEARMHAAPYTQYAARLYAATDYRPSQPPRPCPPAARRPKAMAVSRLDRLTTDPYWLYAYYVLELRELDAVDKEPDASELGSLIHRAMAQLTDHWNRTGRGADPVEIEAIRDAAMAPFAANPEAALFWNHRLARALHFVNGLEAERRALRPQVSAEKIIEETMRFEEASLTLHGRIDRLEAGGDLAVGDYKTGAVPTKAEMADGRAPQLLAYALMLEAAGHKIGTLDYWKLPGGRQAGEVIPAAFTEETIADLHGLIGRFLDPAMPLLARPVPNSKTERHLNPYDGVSRYDEWAG